MLIWEGGVVTTVDYKLENTVLFGINDLGQSVGASNAPGNVFTTPLFGFVATPAPTPEPATWDFTAAGLGVLLVRSGYPRQRWRKS